MYNDQNLYLINEWSDILNHDIILKVISNKNTPPKDFSKLLSLSNQLHLEFYIEAKVYDILRSYVDERSRS